MPVNPLVEEYLKRKLTEQDPPEQPGFDGQRLLAGAGDALGANARNQMRIYGVNPEGGSNHEQALLNDRERVRKHVQDREAERSRAASKLYDIDTRNEERQDTERRHRETLAATRAAASAKAQAEAAKPTTAQESVDRDYGKSYNEWTSSGKPALNQNLQRLEEAAARLEELGDDSTVSGRFAGRMPDFLRSDEAIRIRDDVHAAAQGALRATLGAQFTEKEGMLIMQRAYDERLPPSENVRRIRMEVEKLKSLAANNDAKARHYEQQGTLRDYKSGAAPRDVQPQTVQVSNGQEILEIPLEDLADAEADGFRRIK